jgi:thiol-disulfide isomerase/thioredoxin
MDDLEARYLNNSDTTYVINFWATWCLPCIEELPYFEALNEDPAFSHAKVLLVSLDNPKQMTGRLIPFVEKRGLKSEILLLNEQSPHQYIDRIDASWGGSIPATLFINNNKGLRKFYEKQFDQEELFNIVKSIIN